MKRYHIPLKGGAYVAMDDEAEESFNGHWVRAEDMLELKVELKRAKKKLAKLEKKPTTWLKGL